MMIARRIFFFLPSVKICQCYSNNNVTQNFISRLESKNGNLQLKKYRMNDTLLNFFDLKYINQVYAIGRWVIQN